MPKLPNDLVGRHYELMLEYRKATDESERRRIQTRMDAIWEAANEEQSRLITAQVKLIDRPKHGKTA